MSRKSFREQLSNEGDLFAVFGDVGLQIDVRRHQMAALAEPRQCRREDHMPGSTQLANSGDVWMLTHTSTVDPAGLGIETPATLLEGHGVSFDPPRMPTRIFEVDILTSNVRIDIRDPRGWLKWPRNLGAPPVQ